MTISVKKRWLLALLALFLLAALGLSGCSSAKSGAKADQAASGQAQDGWPRTVQTDDGPLKLKAKPKKVVSTSITLTGALLALDTPPAATAVTKPNIPETTDASGYFLQWSKQAQAAHMKTLFTIGQGSAEKVAAEQPDLILVSKTGGDSMYKQVEQLRQIAPVMVVNYLGKSWQQVNEMVAKGVGAEKQAQAVEQKFQDKLAAAKQAIKLPQGTTSAFMARRDGTVAALQKSAPQARLLTQLGFQLTEPPAAAGDSKAMGPGRKDVVKLSDENIARGLPGDNLILVGAPKKRFEAFKANPLFAKLPAVQKGHFTSTPADTFRLDYFSAGIFLDSLQDSFAK